MKVKKIKIISYLICLSMFLLFGNGAFASQTEVNVGGGYAVTGQLSGVGYSCMMQPTVCQQVMPILFTVQVTDMYG